MDRVCDVSQFSSAMNLQKALRSTQHPAAGTSVSELEFGPDELGEGFSYHYVEMGKDPDREAPVRFTLVRFQPAQDASGVELSQAEFSSRPAILLVHGMTDYFFQRHVAEYFTDLGYAVYGIDLRKCGRSWREGQTWHHVSKQRIYGEDLTIAAALITNAHPSLTVFGHSNGGLGVTMWASRQHHDAVDMPESPQATLFSRLDAVVLNSPWFGLQFNAMTRILINKVIPVVSHFRPNLQLKGGVNPINGVTLHTSEKGEWDYNLELKPVQARPKSITWLTGVATEIRNLQTGNYSTGLPTLLLCSDKHYFGRAVDERAYTSDVILKPSQMREQARNADPNTDVAVIKDGLHDIFLSRLPVRNEALAVTSDWLAHNRRSR